MKTLVQRLCSGMLLLMVMSLPAVSQQEVDPDYYAPVPEPASQHVRPTATAAVAGKNTKPALVSTAYHPNTAPRKARKSAVSGRKSSVRK